MATIRWRLAAGHHSPAVACLQGLLQHSLIGHYQLASCSWALLTCNGMLTGRTTVFTKEAPEGEEAPEPTEEESEQGPEPLSTLEKDTEVEGGEAWTPLFSSTNSGVKNQVLFCTVSLTSR